jgi:hypothetical protein
MSFWMDFASNMGSDSGCISSNACLIHGESHVALRVKVTPGS